MPARKARALARSDTKTAAALQGDYDKAKTELDRLVKAEQRMLVIQRGSRLSIQPVSRDEYQTVVRLAKALGR